MQKVRLVTMNNIRNWPMVLQAKTTVQHGELCASSQPKQNKSSWHNLTIRISSGGKKGNKLAFYQLEIYHHTELCSKGTGEVFFQPFLACVRDLNGSILFFFHTFHNTHNTHHIHASATIQRIYKTPFANEVVVGHEARMFFKHTWGETRTWW